MKLLAVGIGIHHSGISCEEREITEQLFRAGMLRVIFCTSTLAAGVNLPATRVIITNTRIAGPGKPTLPCTIYRQMIGRTGRTQGTKAQSILIASDKNLAV